MPFHDTEQGTRLFYASHGSGARPLVFVHGFACDHSDWQKQVGFYRRTHRVVTCDLRGHGRSDPPSERLDIETLAQDVQSLLHGLRLGRCVLIGHSMGCRVVLQAFLKDPHEVAALVLVEGSRIGMGEPRVAVQRARQSMQSSGYHEFVRQMFDGMFCSGSAAPLKERVMRRALNLPATLGAPLFLETLRWDARWMEAALARVTVPMLVLQSTFFNEERERIILQPGQDTDWLRLVREHAPRAQIQIIPGVGHFAMLEAPRAVNRAVAAFLKKAEDS